MDLCELVRYSVGDVGSGCGSAVCSEDDAVFEVDCHAKHALAHDVDEHSPTAWRAVSRVDTKRV